MLLLVVEIIWFAGFSYRLGRQAEASQLVGPDKPTAVAAAHGQQALCLEDSQGLPQRDQADVELLDEHFLARQQIAVGELALDDLPTQLIGDDFGRPARREPTADLEANPLRSHCLGNANSDDVRRRGSIRQN